MLKIEYLPTNVIDFVNVTLLRVFGGSPWFYTHSYVQGFGVTSQRKVVSCSQRLMIFRLPKVMQGLP